MEDRIFRQAEKGTEDIPESLRFIIFKMIWKKGADMVSASFFCQK